MTSTMLDRLRYDEGGLVPAVVQDEETGAVLMLAYMNRESLRRTLETGETHFWSRRRREIWHKGETSGNTQTVRTISLDCDADALLVTVRQKGNACHTGEYSCFFTSFDEGRERSPRLWESLGRLARTVRQRGEERPQGSYTVKLLESGTDRILKKFGEEAGEVIIAAKNHAKQEIAWEVADLLYHTLVLLEAEEVLPGTIADELERRAGTKKSRG
ncbi:MAG: bifunctional phosphoribosyl-AMP cyclohydrolase/phosphoribosyl-ATP diphosphatase HisIE [Bacteroidota bacterium]